MSLLQKLFDVDAWKQRVKALSSDLNTTYDKLCEANKRAFLLAMENEKLKTQLQTALSNYDERDNDYNIIEVSYDKLKREKEVVTTELKNTQIVFEVVVKNLESQLQAAKEAAIKQDDALHDKEQEVEKLLTEISEVVYAKELLKNTLTSRDLQIIALKENLQSSNAERVFRATEYKILSEQYDKLHKVNESLTTKIAALELAKSIANEKFSTEKDSLVKNLAAEIYERSLCETAIENYKATVAKQDDQLRIASNDIISLREKLRTALNENSKLKQENEALSKTLAEAISKYTTIGLEKNKLQTENVALVRRLSDSHGQPELRIRNSNLEHELTATIKDRDTYKALATHNHNSNLRLIDKIKAIHEVVKVLEPISMKFQTVLFNLLDDTNVPRT